MGEYLALERKYEAERRKLKEKYDKLQMPILEDRRKLLLAEPAEKETETSGTPALSGFWLQALMNHPIAKQSDAGRVESYDEPVLRYLKDITAEELSYEEDKGYKLKFYFEKNPYFEHDVLETTYHIVETSPYTGLHKAVKIEATEIQWNSGKDVTIEVVTKKVKGGGKKKAKQKGKEKEQPRPSFFRSMFRSIEEGADFPQDMKQIMLGDEEIDDDDFEDEEMVKEFMEELEEVATAIKDELVPFAVRWYTGEAAEDDDDDDDEDEESEDDDDSEEESDEDDSPKPKKGGKGSKKPAAAGGAKQEECKQQ